MGFNLIPYTNASVFDPIKTLSQLNQQAIVRPNNPPPGIGGYLFEIVCDESVEMESDITDNFVENNTALQDQIGLKPEQITLHGIVAELAEYRAESFVTYDVNTTTVLPVQPLFEPQFTPQAIQKRTSITYKSVATKTSLIEANSLVRYFDRQAGTPPDTTKQTRAFLYFRNLWKARQLMSVETAWGIYTNMAILSFRAEQPEETKYKSDFTITFKQMRFAGDVTINAGQLAGRASQQAAPVSQNGNAGKTSLTAANKQSLLFSLVEGAAQ